MFKKMHKNESGQAALETAIILIAFVVVASVFAFTILSAGSASTEKGKQAIAAGMEGVQSSMEVKGAIVAKGSGTKLTSVSFTVSVSPGGAPVDLNTTKPVVQIAYRDSKSSSYLAAGTGWTVKFINSGKTAGDTMLKPGDLAEITATVPVADAPGVNEAFTIEVKPPTGAVLKITRTVPAAIDAVMDLN